MGPYEDAGPASGGEDSAALASLAALVGTGILVKTGPATWATRTITGSASRVSVANGDGVAGNPVIDIDAAYVGQTSITTLGTITAGTWNATAIGPTKGGTGLVSYNQGDILYASASNTLSALAKDTNTSRYLSNTGGSNNPAWAQISLTTGVSGILPVANGGTANSALAALTKTDDTNVTLTLGGSPTTALVNAASITAGWAGTLSTARGGTGSGSIGSANQVLGVNAGASALEYKTLTATSNQVSVTHGVGTVTLATPQDIGTGSSVTFANVIASTALKSTILDSNAASDLLLKRNSTTGITLGASSLVTFAGAIIAVGNQTFTGQADTALHTGAVILTDTNSGSSRRFGFANSWNATSNSFAVATLNLNIGVGSSSADPLSAGTMIQQWDSTGSTIPGNLTVTGTYTGSNLSASQAVFTSVSKGLVSNAITGTGNVVMSTNAVLVTPALGTPSAIVLTNATGTASGLTAGNVTTNANLTGPITSVGNATSIASQTGTGTKFVVDTSPTLVTPNIGVASATSLSTTGTITSSAGTNSLIIKGAAVSQTNSNATGAQVVFADNTGTAGLVYRYANNAGIGGTAVPNQLISTTNANDLEIYTLGSAKLILGTNSTAYLGISSTGNVGIVATNKFNLDGFAATGDTYLVESSANTMDLVAGGATNGQITASGSYMNGCYLDNGCSIEFAVLVAQGNPTNPASGNANFYLRSTNKKLTCAYNDGGTMKYFTLDVSATSNQSWVYSASAP